MGLTYHFSFSAPPSIRSVDLADFLRGVEGAARLMGFNPTTVVDGPFDTSERRSFARRVSRGLLVEDDRLRDVKFSRDFAWNHGDGTGYCRLAPEYGALLVVTDSRGCETVFGFFRYPRTIVDIDGRAVMEVPGNGGWTSRDCIKSPDQRYRSIVRRFASAGYLESEHDEFHVVSTS